MSRAYRISVKESLSRHVQVDDGVSSSLELLPILQKERMRELLAVELIARGFERTGDLASRSLGDGVAVEVHLESGRVDVVARGQAKVELTEERSAISGTPGDVAREQALRAAARGALEQAADAEATALRRRVTTQLEGVLRDAKAELDAVVNRVTAEALKVRASELGEVEAIHEEPNGNLTIKVRL